ELRGEFLIRRMELVFRGGERGGSREGVLVCPLEKGERVADYAMEVNGKRRQGVVVPRERAVSAYENLVRKRIDPGVLTIDGKKGTFETKVFPIEAGGLKTVWITTWRRVAPGKVTVWPEGFGTSRKWRLERVGAGGDLTLPVGFGLASPGEEWRMVGVGGEGEGPGLKVGWKYHAGNSVSWVGENDSRYEFHVKKIDQRAGFGENPVVGLWVDASCPFDAAAERNLSAFLKGVGEGTLRVFLAGDKVERWMDCTVAEGRCAELVDALRARRPAGWMRVDRLPWGKWGDGRGAAALLTDGRSPGRVSRDQLAGGAFCLIEAGEGETALLRSLSRLALRGGGTWLRDGGAISLGRALAADEEFLLDGGAVWLARKSAGKGKETRGEVAKWAWALARLEGMKAEGAGERELDKFRYERLVMDAAHFLFTLVARLEPGRYVSHWDLGHSWREGGEPREAAEELWRAIRAVEGTDSRWKGYQTGVELIILEELNAILRQEKITPGELGMDPRLARYVPVGLRVLMEWDSEKCNVDLRVKNRLLDGAAGRFGRIRQRLPGLRAGGGELRRTASRGLARRGPLANSNCYCIFSKSLESP
ncbi:MAG: VIT domain-containing protein, partial [Anaerorhabdus sp.]|uniref:VIT domain-containing protein n=1 Tax=Anaerorhabdus sp. TaxID=1872524 RepID=UPI003A85BAAB